MYLTVDPVALVTLSAHCAFAMPAGSPTPLPPTNLSSSNQATAAGRVRCMNTLLNAGASLTSSFGAVHNAISFCALSAMSVNFAEVSGGAVDSSDQYAWMPPSRVVAWVWSSRLGTCSTCSADGTTTAPGRMIDCSSVDRIRSLLNSSGTRNPPSLGTLVLKAFMSSVSRGVAAGLPRLAVTTSASMSAIDVNGCGPAHGASAL